MQKDKCKPKTEWPQRNLEETLKRYEDRRASLNKSKRKWTKISTDEIQQISKIPAVQQT